MIFGFIANSYAGPYPVPSSVSTRITGPGSATYNISWMLIDIPAADLPAPVDWTFAQVHRHDNFPGGADLAVYDTHPPDDGHCGAVNCLGRSKAGETMSQTAMRITQNGKGLVSNIINHNGNGNGGECIAYAFINRSENVARTPWNRVVFPGGSCVYAPPGNDFCKITTPKINIDYGIISLSDANGLEASQWVNMRCTTATKVTLRLASGVNYIPMQDNSRADIKVNGQLVGGQYDFQKGDTQVEIKSILEDIHQAGDYSGYTVMVIEPA